MNIRSVWVVRAVVLTAFLFFLVSSSWGQTGRSAAVTANRSARVSVPVDWSTDYVVAPMVKVGGVRFLTSEDPRVLHRRLLAQPRTNGRLSVSVAPGSVYYERENSAGDEGVDQTSEGRFSNIDGGVGAVQTRVRGRPPRRFRQRSFVNDWFFPTSGGLGGSVTGSPAKFNFDVTAAPSCANDILYVPINVAGSSVKANLIALNNLYTNSGGTGACAGTGPTILWTMGFTGLLKTSPVLSLDGSLLFVVESLSGGAVVHAIKTGSVSGTCPGGAGTCTLTSAATPSTPTNQLWSATLSGSANDSISSPFIKYTFTTPDQDELYVADDAGLVHRFTSINTSSGAEATTGGWPATVSSGVQLSSPTVDASTGNLFVGDVNGKLSRVVISSGAVTSSAVIGGSSPFGGIVDAPVIDVTNGKVLVTTGNFFSGFAALLAEFPETFAAGASPTAQANLGKGGVANMHRPAFDNAFLSTGSGNAYVGGVSASGNDTLIFRFPYTSAGLGGTSTSISLTNTGTPAGGETSPVTVFRNATTSTEFAYISGLAAGEQFINRMSTATFSSVANFNSQAGGTSPLVVDNNGSGAEQSNIYFGELAGAASRLFKLSQQF